MRTEFLIACFAFLCHNLGAQVTITGSLKNYGNSYITVGKTSSYELLGELDTIFLDNTSFIIQLDLDRPATVNIDFYPITRNATWQRIVIFADPEEEVHFDINFENRHTVRGFPICKFSGTNAAGHELFYAFQYFPFIDHVGRLEKIIETEKDAESAYRQFLIAMEEDFIEPYRQMLVQGQIDESYFKNATDYIKTGIVSTIVTSLYRGGLSLSIADNEEKLQLINLLLDYSPPMQEVSILAGLQFSFLTHCWLFEELAKKGMTEYTAIPDTTVVINGHEFTLDSPFSTVFRLKGKTLQEFFIAHYLLIFYQTMMRMADRYDTSLAFFKAKFPNSKYLDTLKKARNKNVEASVSFRSKPRVEPPRAEYYTKWEFQIIDELGKIEDFSYSDKNIDLKAGNYYVDIWATWCQPCLAEMTHNYHADSLLDANKIKRLYISIDKVTSYDSWIAKINHYHLGGYHILASEKLKALLSREFGMRNGAIQIPRYLFIKSGQVVIESAARPSELRKLHQQVEELISP